MSGCLPVLCLPRGNYFSGLAQLRWPTALLLVPWSPARYPITACRLLPDRCSAVHLLVPIAQYCTAADNAYDRRTTTGEPPGSPAIGGQCRQRRSCECYVRGEGLQQCCLGYRQPSGAWRYSRPWCHTSFGCGEPVKGTVPSCSSERRDFD